MAVRRVGTAGTVDLAANLAHMHRYIVEDFPPAIALRRMQMFTKYFAANFAFGHGFNVRVGNAESLEEALARAEEFFSGRQPRWRERWWRDCKSRAGTSRTGRLGWGQ